MTIILDIRLKHSDATKFAAENTKPGMYHLAIDNEFRRCGGCCHFMKTDQRAQKGVKTSRCALLHKHNGPKARKNQRRVQADYFGCKHWESGKQAQGRATDHPTWKQEAMF